MDIKRRSERKDLKVFLKVLDEGTGELFGYMVDVTNEGIMLTSEQPIEIETDFQLKMILPAEIEGKNELSFSAKSKWSEKDSESDFYNTGFQYIELSPDDMRIVEQLIKNYCFKEE